MFSRYLDWPGEVEDIKAQPPATKVYRTIYWFTNITWNVFCCSRNQDQFVDGYWKCFLQTKKSSVRCRSARWCSAPTGSWWWRRGSLAAWCSWTTNRGRSELKWCLSRRYVRFGPGRTSKTYRLKTDLNYAASLSACLIYSSCDRPSYIMVSSVERFGRLAVASDDHRPKVLVVALFNLVIDQAIVELLSETAPASLVESNRSTSHSKIQIILAFFSSYLLSSNIENGLLSFPGWQWCYRRQCKWYHCRRSSGWHCSEHPRTRGPSVRSPRSPTQLRSWLLRPNAVGHCSY